MYSLTCLWLCIYVKRNLRKPSWTWFYRCLRRSLQVCLPGPRNSMPSFWMESWGGGLQGSWELLQGLLGVAFPQSPSEPSVSLGNLQQQTKLWVLSEGTLQGAIITFGVSSLIFNLNLRPVEWGLVLSCPALVLFINMFIAPIRSWFFSHKQDGPGVPPE